MMLDVFNEVAKKRPVQDWQDGGSLSLTASYSFDSLIPWSGAKENLLQAEDNLRKARSQLQETKVNSELSRLNLKRSIDQAVGSLSSLELNVQLAQKAYDLSQAAYNQGSKDLLAVQSAEGDLNNARYKVLAQRYTLLSNLLSLEYELNVPFGTLLNGKK
jgi:outer membrane protein TolC